MAYAESNGNVTDDVTTVTRDPERSSREPNTLESKIAKTAGMLSATTNNR